VSEKLNCSGGDKKSSGGGKVPPEPVRKCREEIKSVGRR